MTNEEMAVKITEIDQRSKSNVHRISTLEEDNKALTRMAISIEVLATEQKNVSKKVDSIESKVSIIEGKPGKRWEAVVEKVILCLASAAVAFLLARVGL